MADGVEPHNLHYQFIQAENQLNRTLKEFPQDIRNVALRSAQAQVRTAAQQLIRGRGLSQESRASLREVMVDDLARMRTSNMLDDLQAGEFIEALPAGDLVEISKGASGMKDVATRLAEKWRDEFAKKFFTSYELVPMNGSEIQADPIGFAEAVNKTASYFDEFRTLCAVVERDEPDLLLQLGREFASALDLLEVRKGTGALEHAIGVLGTQGAAYMTQARRAINGLQLATLEDSLHALESAKFRFDVLYSVHKNLWQATPRAQLRRELMETARASLTGAQRQAIFCRVVGPTCPNWWIPAVWKPLAATSDRLWKILLTLFLHVKTQGLTLTG